MFEPETEAQERLTILSDTSDTLERWVKVGPLSVFVFKRLNHKLSIC
jgi:hypothetical protein